MTKSTRRPTEDGRAEPVGGAEISAAGFRVARVRPLAEPGIAGVTFTDRLPGAYHPRGWIEVDGAAVPAPTSLGHRAQMAFVDPGFFDVLGTPVVAGRSFDSGDLESEAHVVIVNESFVREILGERNPIGRRVRYLNPEQPMRRGSPETEPGPWHEIVGVVQGLTMTIDPDLPHNGGLYHPLKPDDGGPVHMAVHVGTDPGSFAPRLRALATAVDPALKLYSMVAANMVLMMGVCTLACIEPTRRALKIEPTEALRADG